MRFYVVALVIFATFTNFGWSCTTVPAEKQLSDSIGVISFPEPWLKLREGKQRVVNENVHYVVHKTSNELVLAVKQGFDARLHGQSVTDFPIRNPDYDYYSDNHFAISLDGKFNVRKAGDSEWTSGTKVVHSYHFIETHKNPQFTEQGLAYKDRLYRKTGASWGTRGALISPNERWIAIFSFSSTDKGQPALIPGFGGEGPRYGEAFLDIYDLSSGQKVAAHHARFGNDSGEGGVSPSLLFGAAVWIEDHYLIMPLTSDLQRCFLAVLP